MFDLLSEFLQRHEGKLLAALFGVVGYRIGRGEVVASVSGDRIACGLSLKNRWRRC
jgi:hypothetical protein